MKSSKIIGLIVLGIIVVGLFLFGFLFRFYTMSGPAMCPTLNQPQGECLYEKGELILVSRRNTTPQAGEIVVFQSPIKNKRLIKRVIGTPGDRVKIENGNVFWSDGSSEFVELPESYLSPKNKNAHLFQTYQKQKHSKFPKGNIS